MGPGLPPGDSRSMTVNLDPPRESKLRTPQNYFSGPQSHLRESHIYLMKPRLSSADPDITQWTQTQLTRYQTQTTGTIKTQLKRTEIQFSGCHPHMRRPKLGSHISHTIHTPGDSDPTQERPNPFHRHKNQHIHPHKTHQRTLDPPQWL